MTFTSLAQTVCDTSANVIIYSNYDGGALHINVDENISNLKIGVVSYEPDSIIISGTYSGNISEVRYAGYDDDNLHNHCGFTTPTLIVGAPTGADIIDIYPTVTLHNPNGESNIICNFLCDTSLDQQGCNTSDQIVDYFLQNFGGSLRFYKTQYGCWTGIQNISTGGNCCIGATTGIEEFEFKTRLNIFPNPHGGQFAISINNAPNGNAKLTIIDKLGRIMIVKSFVIDKQEFTKEINLPDINRGVYFLKLHTNNGLFIQKMLID
jgi:hypothetical protein